MRTSGKAYILPTAASSAHTFLGQKTESRPYFLQWICCVDEEASADTQGSLHAGHRLGFDFGMTAIERTHTHRNSKIKGRFVVSEIEGLHRTCPELQAPGSDFVP